MKALLTADLHRNANPRDAYRRTFLTSTLPSLLKKHSVDFLIVLGDITEKKDHHGAALVNEIVDDLRSLAAAVSRLILLKGNHDYKDEDSPFFQFARHIPNIIWIGEPTSFNKWLFLPHTNNWRRDWDSINMSHEAIFTHNTFAGAMNENNDRLDGIPLTVFPSNCPPVFSGDVHVPQKLDCVTYVGAPYTMKFGDRFNPRVILIEFDGLHIPRKVESIPVPGPQKRLIEMAWPNRDISPDSWTNYIDPRKQLRKGDMIRLKVSIEPQQVARWTEIKNGILEWGTTNGFRIDAVLPISPNSAGRSTAATVPARARKPDDQLLRDYAATKNLDRDTTQSGLNTIKIA